MNRVNVNGIEISYRLEGAGEPLVLIGGFGMTQEFWDLQRADLSSRFRVLLFDNRGAGGSTVPSAPFTMADMARDVAGLMDALDIEWAHICGLSMGGMIAQLLCLDYPERVRKAVLACTSYGGGYAVAPNAEVVAALAQAANPELTPEQAARQMAPYLLSERFRRESPDGVEAFIRLCVQHALSAEGAVGQLGALGSFTSEDRLGNIRCPVLVLAGGDDRIIPPENARLLHDKIPGSTMKIIPEAGHNLFYEVPQVFNTLIASFFLAP